MKMSILSASISAPFDRMGRVVVISAAALWLTTACAGTQSPVAPQAPAAPAAPAVKAATSVPATSAPALSPEAKQAKKLSAAKEREHLRKAWEAERKEIQGKRDVIEQQRLADEKLCYQKFAVEDCLTDARRAAREKDVPLRARELEVNEAERKDKAAERLQTIEEKKADNAAVPMKAQQREKMPGTGPQPTGPGAKPEVDEAAARAQRQSEAQQRAAKQGEYVRRHEQNRAQADQGRAEREAKARADYEAKVKEAEAHKASVLKKAQEAGKKPAAPLPAPAP